MNVTRDYGGVAIVIPCYRVAERIGDVIRAIPPHYRTIICVDDASPDGSAAAIVATGDPRVTFGASRYEPGGSRRRVRCSSRRCRSSWDSSCCLPRS